MRSVLSILIIIATPCIFCTNKVCMYVCVCLLNRARVFSMSLVLRASRPFKHCIIKVLCVSSIIN